MLRAFYRLLLLAYPRDFRRTHGGEAVQLFVDACRDDRRTRGRAAVMARVLRALVDVPGRGFAERAASRSWSRWPLIVSDLQQDVRFGIRSLRRAPAFTLTAILTMTIGIAVSTGMFTVLNAVGLRGWPVEHADTLVIISADGPISQVPSGLGLDDLERFRQSRSLAAIAGSRSAFNANVALEPNGRGGGGYGQYVTPEFFDATGVRLILGRNFRPDEDREGAPAPVVIISYRLWHRLFAGATDVLGRAVYIGQTAHAVIGVTREGWQGAQPYRDDVWLPLQSLRRFSPQDSLVAAGGRRCCLQILGRLAPGISRARAAEELTTLLATGPEGRRRQVRVSGTSMYDRASTSARATVLGMVSIATLLVLLLTGANIAHLQLARAMSRAREIRTRIALGAARGRVVRQLIAESLVLTTIAGALSMVLVYALLGTMMRLSEMELRTVWTPNLTVYAYCVAVSLTMSAIFSLLPALRMARLGLIQGAGQTATAPRLRFNLTLLATQIALSVPLLTSAVLLNRVLAHAIRGDAGFPIDGLTVVSYEPSGASSLHPDAARALRQSIEHTLATSSLPPIGLVDGVPFSSVSTARVQVNGERGTVAHDLDVAPMSASTFEVLGIPLVQGRAHSDGEGALEAVINERAAGRILPGQSPIGATLVFAKRTYTIVGVTRDVHIASRGTIRPTLHVSPATTRRFPIVLIRADARLVSDRASAIIARIDPRATVSVRTLSDTIAARLGDERTGSRAAWAGGLLALALATFGVFGVFAYAVEDRRREIGIRVALGADRRDVLAALFRPARLAVISGLGLGLVLSLGLGPILENMGMNLFGHSPFDPVAFAVVGAILSAAAFAGTVVPARRALGVDPSLMLKQDA